MEAKKLSPLEQKINDFIYRYLTTVSFVDKMMFVHHLQIMTKAGLSIITSLKILSEETENKKLKIIIAEIKSEVEKGQQLSVALGKYPKVFPPVYVSMIAAGEVAGKLEEALTEVAGQMKKSHELMSKVRGAMIYPAVIFTVMVGIAFFVVLYIFPKILVMFEETQTELPLPTKMLIYLTNFMQNYWYWVLIGIAALVYAYFRAMKAYPFKKAMHSLRLKLPIFGAIIKKINLANFTLTLCSLLNSTIPIIEAVKISSDVLGNVIYKEKLKTASESLKKGINLSEVLSRHPEIFPPMVTEMIMVGEQTGSVEKMLNELSEYYNAEVNETMSNFTSVIEPIIILVLGLGVAGVAVSVIMPMYALTQNI
ncbi:MAG TPA: type II secretion system F family protein [Candidatus Magasanikbacteria bacterium]|nr:type II secretion system F family protein [Candidatus Magasanikbacteria bacterium]